jgi:hypothetical protein
MSREIPPADLGRLHALQRMVAHLDTLADGVTVPDEPGEVRDYLRAYARTFRDWAARLRNSPGFQP